MKQYADLSTLDAQAQAVATTVSPSVMDALFMAVVRGELDKVENSLQANPELVHAQGNLRDLAGRIFPQVTALQYAVWSLDVPLWTMIMKYMDPEDAAQQMQALEARKDITNKQGLHCDFSPLLEHYQALIDNWGSWSWSCINDHWINKIGSKQAKLPAWMIYLFTESGNNVAWTVQDESRLYTRIQSNEFKNWGEHIHQKFAWYRGREGGSVLSRTVRDKTLHHVKHDLTMIQKCLNAAMQSRQLLKETMHQSLPSQTTMGLMPRTYA